MIDPAQILEEYEFWKRVQTKVAALGLQTDGVMDTAISAMVAVFYDALYGNGGAMKTEAQWKEQLIDAKRFYDTLKDLQCSEIDAVFFYNARAILWATAIVAGWNPEEVVDGKEAPKDASPADKITDVITEIV